MRFTCDYDLPVVSMSVYHFINVSLSSCKYEPIVSSTQVAFRDCGTYYSTVFNPLSEDFEPAV